MFRVSGIVQGVGFRPYVYNLALSFGLKGYVLNTSEGVEIVVSGKTDTIRRFRVCIEQSPPDNAALDSFEEVPFCGTEIFTDFRIRESIRTDTKSARISPDLMVCDECVRELFDPADRRFLYPYINCTNCGPRYTITKDIPYDRPNTSMAGFVMCPECMAEYTDPADRRFHAQPNACHICGPHLDLADRNGQLLSSPRTPDEYNVFFLSVANALDQGKIIAVKGIGGFHLMCDAENENAVTELRTRKFRESKPFAVMTADIAAARSLAFLSPDEENRLAGKDRPILLAEKKHDAAIAPSVSPETHIIGIMLPCTPLQYLVFRYFRKLLVMTSANISDEPIVHINAAAAERLKTIADLFIYGNRDILIRCDDPVTRIWQGAEYPVRRSRGLVPSPVFIKHGFLKNILALGAEQKNTVALAKQNQAILSHHIGDLVDAGTYDSFIQAIRHLAHITDCRPGAIACDLHPDYLSTKFANSPPDEFLYLKELPLIQVQHHHAHIAACMAENNISGKVIGIALDGTGLGTDNTIWGGEILLSDYSGFQRAGMIRQVPLPGGSVSIRKPWRMAVSYLYALFHESWKQHLPSAFSRVSSDEMEMTVYQISEKLNTPMTSSCGRLFDAVAALCGITHYADYEGQGAIELEQQIQSGCSDAYWFDIVQENGTFIIDWKPVIEMIVNDIAAGTDSGIISAQFHNGLADVFHNVCTGLKKTYGINDVVLSGGCFMNMYLLGRLFRLLASEGFTVYTHSKVPCNDGGISLGQAVIADAILKGE